MTGGEDVEDAEDVDDGMLVLAVAILPVLQTPLLGFGKEFWFQQVFLFAIIEQSR